MKKLLFFLGVSFLSVSSVLAQVTITDSFGWLESAVVKWQPVSGAESYNVYYTGEGITNRKIDMQLIRSYGSYMRADIPGLKAGSYTVTVAPVIGGAEQTIATTGALTVLAHDRTGFAFANNRVPGAYKADGTLKDNAVVIYLTENSKNTVSLNVTSANSNPCIGIQTILDGYKKGKDTRPLVVRLIGQVTDPSYTLGGDVVIENANNASSYITFEGIGDDAVADGWGIRIKNASNVEVRNVGTMNCNSSEGDNIGLQQNNDYIWVHNCDFFYGNAGSDADQIKGDGALDCKKSTYVTFSYNHFWDNGKCNLLGLSEGTTTGLYITYHHNWYDHSDSRHPRVRYYSAHVYNNYYDGNAKYGVGSTLGSSVFVENNYFRNCKYPMLTSMQGTDVFNTSTKKNDYVNMPTFSKEDGGTIKAYNNTISGASRYVAYGNPGPEYNIAGAVSSTIDFDAYEVTDRSTQVPSTVKSVYGSNMYNNFDTDAALYVKNLVPDAPEVARDKVMQYAGRIQGGDLKWTFNNAVDDASYAVNTALKAALTSYKTTLVAIQGESSTGGGSNSSQTLSLTSDGNADQTVSTGTAITDIVYAWGGDATDVTVTGIPASGLTLVKDATAKTVTISGTPTATVNYTVTTSGSAGSSVSATGTITLSNGGTTSGNQIHNFTESEKTSTFYTITGNMNSTNGSVTYDGLTLTRRLKIESSTSITFTAAQAGNLTLVFDADFTGKIKLNNVDYTASAGVVTIPVVAGTNSITKNNTANLFYIKLVYNTTSVPNSKENGIRLYPLPVKDKLNITSDADVNRLEVISLTGKVVLTATNVQQSVDVSGLPKGSYLVRLTTRSGTSVQKLIKD